MKESEGTAAYDPEEAGKTYDQLGEFAAQRLKELSEMLAPFIEVTDKYGRLMCRVVCLLGTIKPASVQDRVVRDLTADVFDSLYEARSLILGSKLPYAWLLGRRAYESLSLLSACMLDPKYAEDWESGKQLPNAEIRKFLGKTFGKEGEEQARDLYRFFSLGSHPNRELVAYRWLGEGNMFTLGVVGVPGLLMTADFCHKHLDLWFWFGASVSSFYRELISQNDKEYMPAYFKAADELRETMKWLMKSFNHLLEEQQEEAAKNKHQILLPSTAKKGDNRHKR